MSLTSQEKTQLRESSNDLLKKKYFNFENKWMSCWIDSPLSLLAHNKILHNFVKDNLSLVSDIVNGYESAINTFNDGLNESNVNIKLEKGVSSLRIIQDNTFTYLEPIMHCKKGIPDSAFCCLLNLIKENEEIKKKFLVNYSVVRNCSNCPLSEIKIWNKTIITLSDVKAFNPKSPVALFKCPNCSAEKQEMDIKYNTVPPCLIFHFENGTGESFFEPRFTWADLQYELSGLMERKKYLNVEKNKHEYHYRSWVLNGDFKDWLQCDDLNRNILSFGDIPISFQADTCHIVMYEALDHPVAKSIRVNKEIIKMTPNYPKFSLDLQDNPSLTSSEKKSTDENKKDSLLKDSIEGDGIISVAVPILEGTEKTSEENSEKALIGATSSNKNVESVVAAEGDVIKNECFTEGAVGDNTATNHDAEKSVETSTFPKLQVKNSLSVNFAEKTVVKRSRKSKICAICNECTSTGKVSRKRLEAQNSPPKKMQNVTEGHKAETFR